MNISYSHTLTLQRTSDFRIDVQAGKDLCRCTNTLHTSSTHGRTELALSKPLHPNPRVTPMQTFLKEFMLTHRREKNPAQKNQMDTKGYINFTPDEFLEDSCVPSVFSLSSFSSVGFFFSLLQYLKCFSCPKKKNPKKVQKNPEKISRTNILPHNLLSLVYFFPGQVHASQTDAVTHQAETRLQVQTQRQTRARISLAISLCFE